MPVARGVRSLDVGRSRRRARLEAPRTWVRFPACRAGLIHVVSRGAPSRTVCNRKLRDGEDGTAVVSTAPVHIAQVCGFCRRPLGLASV